MKIEDFLEKGYFLKELPPCFTTKKFSENILEIIKEWSLKYKTLSNKEKKKYEKSTCIKFSYPKQEMSRRYLSMPNPLHYTELVNEIVNNWQEINKKFEGNKRSHSLPIIDMEKRAIKAKSYNFKTFQENKIKMSYDNFYELKIDISKFYDSIYTHTIAWAIHGKKEAKEKIFENILGNRLDKKLRSCQDGQSIGIPTGPDVSFLLSEIILNDIDKKMKNTVKMCRFADDIYIYANKKEELYKELKEINKYFSDYKLSLNESKLKIKKFPFQIEEKWIIELEKIEKDFYKEKTQKKAIINFFNIIFIEMEKSGKSQILKYGQYKLFKKEISFENWPLFESLLLKSILICPEIIEKGIGILKRHNEFVNKAKLKSLVNKIIELNCELGNDYEVIWALWLAKEFGIKINLINMQNIIENTSSITCVLALDIYKKKLVTTKNDLKIISLLKDRLGNENFYSDEWILYYELKKKKWFSEFNELAEDEYLKILLSKDIEFYNSDGINFNNMEEDKDYIESLQVIGISR